MFAIRRHWVLGLLLVAVAQRALSQTGEAPYNLSVSVDEVILTFHAADSRGLPINDLKLDELKLLDNGKPPRKILAFDPMYDFPIRAGILMDTSGSMSDHLSGNRAISIEYAQRLLRRQTDQAFVMNFGYTSQITQIWTSDSGALTSGILKVAPGGQNPIGGTAIFDTLFRACLYGFGNVDYAASGNFILLFSDGEDNASRTSLEDVVDVCQRTNTAIYAFHFEPKTGSTGPEKLAALASQTGGRVFREDDSEAAIYADLRTIESDLRNQYRLVYKPAALKHDGSFHRIALNGPERVGSLQIRSGYYAPAH
jgi:Ca-activated chloride channel family protein